MENSAFFTFLVFILGSTALSPVSAQEELVYVPVEPCRVVDTRSGGGAITANTNRNFRVSGTMGELAIQGGTTDCLDPKAGTGQKPLAVTAYVVAVPASGSTGGVLTAYPSHLLPPPVGAGSTVNFGAGQVIGNTTTITLCDQIPCPTDGEFSILARNTKQHVVIDVQGYFYPAAMKDYVIVDANDQTIGGVFGGDKDEPTTMSAQGYVATFDPLWGKVWGGANIFYTGANCSGGTYMDLFNSLCGTLSTSAGSFLCTDDPAIGAVYNLLSHREPGPALEYWYVPKIPTFVDNVSIQSVELYDWNAKTVVCDTVSATITTAVEVYPNDPAITGFQNAAFPAPLRYDYR